MCCFDYCRLPLAAQVRRLARRIGLKELKEHAEGGLKDMALFRFGRLSCQHVTKPQWEFVLSLEQQEVA